MTDKFSNAACYVRVSTESQIENYSIEEQTERLKAYCSAKGWTIYDFYVDGGYSGGSIERPAISQMLADIRNNKLDVVVVYKLDRLSRSQKDTLTLIEDEFISKGVEFVSVSESFDTSTPFGKAMIGILSVFAQLEKDQITERFTMGRIGRSKAGYYHGGPIAPTGYSYIGGKLIVNEFKAIQVREVFDKFLSGHSISSIQRQMHAKYGGWKSHSLVINVLRNVVYIGKVKFNKIAYEGIHEPIVLPDVFYKAQTLLKLRERKEQKNSMQKTPFKACNLLTGLIYCGKCGARYSASHGFYKCYSRSKCDPRYIVDRSCKNKNWDIEKLNAIIISEIGKLRYSSKATEAITAAKTELPIINAGSLGERIKAIDGQIFKLMDLYQIENAPFNEISLRIGALQREKDVLAEKLVQAEKHAADTKPQFVLSTGGLYDAVLSGSLEEKRVIVHSIIKAIIPNDEQIRIQWRI